MHRIDEKSCARLRSLCVAVIAAFAVAVSSGSCFLDTKTNLCGNTGLRCPQGYLCSSDQDACIKIGGCGDGATSEGEACDDGNLLDGDGCSADCESDETCGNGKTDVVRNEACDDGNTRDGDGCSASCASEMCGNRILDKELGEVCDDGNGVSLDGCRSDCKSNEVCGNAVMDAHLGEECEFSESPFPNQFSNRIDCDNDCTRPMCGDGHRNTEYVVPDTGQGHPEQCDDGVMGMPTDSLGCDRDCTMAACGDGYTNAAAGEDCDTGDLNTNTSMCNGRFCKESICGDFVFNSVAGEKCDTGGNTQACDGDCSLPRCGDGFPNTNFTPPNASLPEQCDTNGDSLSCDKDCTFRTCGDFYVNDMAGEQCDEVGYINENEDACPNGSGGTCRPAICGDGHRRTQGPPTEACDNGPANSNTQSNACRMDCRAPFCGDGVIDDGEICDPGGSYGNNAEVGCGGVPQCKENCTKCD